MDQRQRRQLATVRRRHLHTLSRRLRGRDLRGCLDRRSTPWSTGRYPASCDRSPPIRGSSWSRSRIACLGDVLDIGSGFVLVGLDDDRVRLWGLPYDGAVVEEMPMPAMGGVGVEGPARSPGSGAVSVGGQTVVFAHQSPARSPEVCRVDLDTGESAVVEAAQVAPPGLRTRRLWTGAADGTLLPVQLSFRGDLGPHEPRPLMLTAYGALGQADLPSFVGKFLALWRRAVFMPGRRSGAEVSSATAGEQENQKD